MHNLKGNSKADFEVTFPVADVEPLVFERLREMDRLGKALLADVRARKRRNRKERDFTPAIADLRSMREGGCTAEAELFQVNKVLDRDDLSMKERRSVKKRRTALLKKINPAS